MHHRLFNIWSGLQSSLWFIPALMGLGAIGLAVLILLLDSRFSMEGASEVWWLYAGEPADARELLSTLLSSMISMTTLVVSITMVVLTLTANQLGPRLIRNFMGRTGTQVSIGIFIMTIVYQVVVLRTLKANTDFEEVPHVAVTVGTALAIINLFVLLFFVHYLARSIVADTVVARVGADLGSAIARLLPADDGGPPPEVTSIRDALPDDFDERAAAIGLPKDGYVQAIEFEDLVDLAHSRDILLRLDFRAGHFIIRGGGQIKIYPGDRLDPELAAAIVDQILIGPERSPTQDLEYSIRHLVEIGLRALSPGINDPFTAIAVLDRLGAALAALMCRELQPRVFRDRDGVGRVISRAPSHGGLIDAAFHQIRRAGANQPEVIIHMLEIIGQLAGTVRLPSQHVALMRHALVIAETGRGAAADPVDRAEINRQYQSACAALSACSSRFERS